MRKDYTFIKDMIQPAYYEDVKSWVLDNCDLMTVNDIPRLFGNNTPLQRFFEDDLAGLLNLERGENE